MSWESWESAAERVGYRAGVIDGVDAETRAIFPENGPIHAYLWWAMQNKDVSARMHLAAVLPVFAHEACREGWAIQAENQLQTKNLDKLYGFPLRIWSLILAPSGAGKTQAILFGAKHFHEALLARIEPPRVSPWISLDATSDAGLRQEIGDNHYQEKHAKVVLYSDEFSSIMGSGRHQIATERLCQYYNGFATSNRAGDKRANKQGGKILESVTLTANGIFATTKRSFIAKATRVDLEGGLLPRILMHRFAGNPNDWGVSRARHDTLDVPLNAAMNLFQHWSAPIHRVNPPILVLSNAAAHYIDQNILELARTRFAAGLDDDDDPLNSLIKRGADNAVTIAGVYAWAAKRNIITLEDATRATAYVKMCLTDIEMLEARIEVPRQAIVDQRVLDVFKRHRGEVVTSGTIFEEIKHIFAWERRAAIEKWVDAGTIEEVAKHEIPKPPGAGRPLREAWRYIPPIPKLRLISSALCGEPEKPAEVVEQPLKPDEPPTADDLDS